MNASGYHERKTKERRKEKRKKEGREHALVLGLLEPHVHPLLHLLRLRALVFLEDGGLDEVRGNFDYVCRVALDDVAGAGEGRGKGSSVGEAVAAEKV